MTRSVSRASCDVPFDLPAGAAGVAFARLATAGRCAGTGAVSARATGDSVATCSGAASALGGAGSGAASGADDEGSRGGDASGAAFAGTSVGSLGCAAAAASRDVSTSGATGAVDFDDSVATPGVGALRNIA